MKLSWHLTGFLGGCLLVAAGWLLMLLQWLAAIVAAVWLTPYTWSSASASIHFHVWLAFFFNDPLMS